MNKIPCSACVHFDQQHKIVRGQPVPLRHGICAARSIYPTKEQDGQIFPPDVARVPEGDPALAKRIPVWANGTVGSCTMAIKKA